MVIPPLRSSFIDLRLAADRFRDDVVEGLRASPKTLPPKYFYDAPGSALFEAICELPEYYPTRVEMALMAEYAAAMAAHLAEGCVLIEFGSGASRKTEVLLRHLQPSVYVPVDISSEALRESQARLAAAFPDLPIIAVCADYMQPLQLPDAVRAAAKCRVIYFPGSTIGNLTPWEARTFLIRVAALAGPGGAMLIGVDLKKDPQLLHAAYNDGQGVTAAFNLNLLRRINRELGADFAPAQFRHIAFYNAAAGRVEMHLESLQAQTVRLGAYRFVFEPGERIHTENSYKYEVEEFRRLAESAGCRPLQVWVDDARQFAVHLLEL